MKAVEVVGDKIECVVTTSLPGEERIFWPFYDVQFYIRDDKESISSTGNPETIQRVFNLETQEINTDLPEMDYWKGKDFVYQLDNTNYINGQQLLSGEIELNLQKVLEKYQYRQTIPFENKDWWYILKFFFIASEFNNLDGFWELIGSVPNDLKIKCECETLLNVEFFWKGIFNVPEQEFDHQYYLYVGYECESCGKIVCIYRPKDLITPHFLVFMNSLTPDRKFKMTDIEMVSAWQGAFKKGANKDMDKFGQIYEKDIFKFGEFITKMGREYNK